VRSEGAKPVVLTVGVNGSNDKSINPNIPCGSEEIVEEALRCFEAGASVIHAHNRSTRLRTPDGSVGAQFEHGA